MSHLIKSFAANESGAATVDYVILLAGVVALAIAAMTQIRSLTDGLVGNINSTVDSYESTAFDNIPGATTD